MGSKGQRSVEKELKSGDASFPPKKLNILGSRFAEARKLSGDYNDKKNKGENGIEMYHKSDDHASVNSSNHAMDGEGSEKKSIGHSYEITEIEGAFWKKMRNLETRLKNLSLNYTTLLIKTKQESLRLEKENKYCRAFVANHCSSLVDQMNAYISKCQKEEEEEFVDSSS
jgi:hypothetical protein